MLGVHPKEGLKPAATAVGEVRGGDEFLAHAVPAVGAGVVELEASGREVVVWGGVEGVRRIAVVVIKVVMGLVGVVRGREGRLGSEEVKVAGGDRLGLNGEGRGEVREGGVRGSGRVGRLVGGGGGGSGGELAGGRGGARWREGNGEALRALLWDGEENGVSTCRRDGGTWGVRW